jgi:hypothetical protein
MAFSIRNPPAPIQQSPKPTRNPFPPAGKFHTPSPHPLCDATVSISFDGMNVRQSFAIPRGSEGPPGPIGAPGEVTIAQLSAAIAAAIAETPRNINTLLPYTGTFSDPPTQTEMQDFAAYVEAMRRALVRWCAKIA